VILLIDAEKRKIMFARAKSIVKKNLEHRDRLIINAIHSLDDLEKEINQLCERLKDWYGITFPELESILPEPDKYASMVLALVKNASEEERLKITSKEKLDQILSVKADSMGAAMNEADLTPVLSLAESIVELYQLRLAIEAYLEIICKEVCPNLTYLCGALLTARFLGMAGSIEQLAEMPASTIQVIGAEKALFKHIRRGTAPPKHGIIFQHPLISNADKDKRGKIARALSAKMAIAAKADAFTHHFIAEKLMDDLNKRLKEINA